MKTHRYILFIIACVLSIGTGWAGATRYYKVTVKADTGGKVYVSKSETTVADGDYKNESTQTFNKYSISGTITASAYLYAKANDGYQFTGWTDAGGNEVKSPYNTTINSGSNSNPNNIGTFTAHFEGIGMTTKVSPAAGGSIRAIKNGESTTLVATPSYNYVFDHWTSTGNDLLDSQKKSATITVNANSGYTYTAYYTLKDVVYYRIKNKSSGKYMEFIGTYASKVNSQNNAKFDGSISLVTPSNDHANVNKLPGAIIYVSATFADVDTWSNVVLSAQGVNTEDMLQHAINAISTQITPNKQLTLVKHTANDGTTSYAFLSEQAGNTYCLYDNGSDFVYLMPYDATDNCEWILEPVDGSNDDAYLYLDKQFTLNNGKDYTTLYVTFPFKCAEGMSAYYVTEIQDNEAKCNTGGMQNVPEKTPVIIGWSGENRVVPINAEKDRPSKVDSKAIDEKQWLGQIDLCSSSTTKSTKTFNQTTMRVLNRTTSGGEEKAALSSSNNGEQYIRNNSAYLNYKNAKELYLVIFPLRLNEADEEVGRVNDIFGEVHVIRTLSGPKTDVDEWGCWGTLCLPFDLSAEEIGESFGDHQLKALTDFWASDETIHLRFDDASEIKTGQPYMIRVKSNIADLTLKNKSVNTVDEPIQTINADDYSLEFRGKYFKTAKLPVDAYYINTSNAFKHVTATATVSMKGFRAYFMPISASGKPVRAMVMSNDEPTGVKNIIMEGLEDGAIYNLQGIKQNSLQRGVNIVNGKKILH